MAGSMKDMLYTDDLGQQWVTLIDESAGEAFDFDDYTGAEVIVGRLPASGFQMRYVTWQADDGTISRTYKVGKPNTDEFLNGGRLTTYVLEGNAAVAKIGDITSAQGEKRRLPKAADTGLTDGDAT